MKYGLVLGGGGARGAFEAGVWRALCELKKDITHIAGTSIGAVNGAAFAAGVDTERIWSELRPEHIISGADTDNFLSPAALVGSADDIVKGGLNCEPFRALLLREIPENAVRRSGILFGLCTFSATHKKVIELFTEDIPQGRLIDYILASACFPVFKPVMIDGEEFTDGGIRNNIPEDMLIKRGVTNIISVSAGGIGMVRDIDSSGINIIKISNTQKESGMLDFDTAAIKRSIAFGYYECMKAFGRLSGKMFYVNNRSYAAAVMRYGKKLVADIEAAAQLAGLDRCRQYSFSGLARGTLENYESSAELKKIVRAIEKEPQSFMHSKLELRYKNFDAANAIVYFKRA